MITQVAARPGSQHFKCLLRLAFVPRDAYDLLQSDPTAFEYFYMQVSGAHVAVVSRKYVCCAVVLMYVELWLKYSGKWIKHCGVRDYWKD